MQSLERLAASDLVAVMVAFRDGLRSHQAVINRLNVYPVPDGDTGTNMALTAESVLQEIERQPDQDMATVAKAIAYGSLMGARGNSGVILSQILRGLADAAEDQDELDAGHLADGLAKSADGAYAAVQNPVEGTILSVMRAAADGAAAAGSATLTATLTATLEAAHQAAADALARTPEQLPVLKAAGVVDSGGTGLMLLFDALLHVADGRPLPDPPAIPLGEAPLDTSGATELTGHGAGEGVGDLRYEVMYLLEAPDDLIPPFREVWAGVGDSIVVVGGGGLWNCHIHTDDIGASIEAALEAGRPRQIRVTDLFDQVEEESWVRAAAGTDAEGEGPEEPVFCSVVAVCTGDGIRRIFRSLGVHHVVSGGQSMNPSTADLLEAIEASKSDEVVILPNNKNIIPVAEQAARQASKPVRVVPTKGIQEGFAALLEYDPEGPADSNAAMMTGCAERVVAGEVTRAVRPSSCDAGPIAEGDYIGISRERIEVVATDLAGAATSLLERLVTDDHEIVTVIAGEGSTPGDTRRITEWVADHRPEVTAEVHQGGQPLYPYLFSIE